MTSIQIQLISAKGFFFYLSGLVGDAGLVVNVLQWA